MTSLDQASLLTNYYPFTPSDTSSGTELSQARIDGRGGFSSQSDAANTYYQESLAHALFGQTLSEIQQQPILPTRRPSRRDARGTDIAAVRRRYQKQPQSEPTNYKVLDAPNILNDVYCNILDLSTQNILAIALDNIIYTYKLRSSEIVNLTPHAQPAPIWSVHWINSRELVYGTSNGLFKHIDITARGLLHTTILEHPTGIPVITHLPFTKTVVTGTSSGYVKIIDLRAKKITRLSRHAGKVCSLSFSPDSRLLATGCNDNNIRIFDLRNTRNHLAFFEGHKAAIMSVLWANNHTLVSGGGTADRTIRLWDINSKRETGRINTGSQVCNLFWTKNRELVSTHGYSENTIALWKVRRSEISLLSKLPSVHDNRVLYAAMDTDRTKLVTASSDETIKLWNGFVDPESRSQQRSRPSMLSTWQIR